MLRNVFLAAEISINAGICEVENCKDCGSLSSAQLDRETKLDQNTSLHVIFLSLLSCYHPSVKKQQQCLKSFYCEQHATVRNQYGTMVTSLILILISFHLFSY